MEPITSSEQIEDEEVRLSVPHVAQKFTWDCGLACAQMILSYCHKNFDDFSNVCKRLEFLNSVWTIDLACLLTHYSVKNDYVTVTLGVDKEYSKKSFYKERFDKDQKRVDSLFQDADKHGLNVRKGSVNVEEIMHHLSTFCPLIALTDCNLLNCIWCSGVVSCTATCIGQCLSGMGGYRGHFIVVCGYNKKERVLYYRNPACTKDELCCCTLKVFDRARMAHGTDQDLIFVYHSEKNNPASVL